MLCDDLASPDHTGVAYAEATIGGSQGACTCVYKGGDGSAGVGVSGGKQLALGEAVPRSSGCPGSSSASPFSEPWAWEPGN